jgi:hypothetical protein
MESRAGGPPDTSGTGATLPTIVVNGKPRPWPGSRNITGTNEVSGGSVTPVSLGGPAAEVDSALPPPGRLLIK